MCAWGEGLGIQCDARGNLVHGMLPLLLPRLFNLSVSFLRFSLVVRVRRAIQSPLCEKLWEDLRAQLAFLAWVSQWCLYLWWL